MATTPADSRLVEVWVTTTLRVVAATVIATGCVAAITMVAAGSPIREPLSLSRALTLGIACSGGALAVRWFIAHLRRGSEDPLLDTLLLAPTLVLLLLVFALPAQQTPINSYALLCLFFLGEEAIWWFVVRGTSPAIGVRADQTRAALAPVSPAAEASVDPSAAFPPHVTQRLTRSCVEAEESVMIEFRERFEAAQKRATLHAAFSPPLAVAPEIHIEQVGGPPASIKVTQAEPFGVRLEVRLERILTAPAELLITCYASAPPEDDAQ